MSAGGPPPDDLRAPPSPQAPPPGRMLRQPQTARGSSVVRISAPELARRAQIERTRGRLVIAAGGFALLFGAVGLKLTMATVIDPAQPRLRPIARIPVEAPAVGRAPITDRNGEVLAVSLQVTELYANPQEINDPVVVADRLVGVLPQLDRERLVARLTQRLVPGTETPVQFAYIARNLPPRQQQAINDLGIPGLHFRPAERRFYPQGRAAAHVLGQVDVDGRGIAGVERSFDARLRSDASPLRLSLDVRLQVALRESVQKAIADFNGIGGAGVVLDVQTAEIMAMVSLPDFDASDPGNLLRRQEQAAAGPRPSSTQPALRIAAARAGAAAIPRQEHDPRFNRATVGVYEPGSTFKLLTAAMALDFGTVNIWGGYDASQPIRYGRFQIDDFRGKGRWLALPEILAYSSNVASAHMAMAVGITRHREFMGRMGLLNRLGVELPETARPLAPSPAHWRDINTMTIAFGHGISVTPLHVVNAVASLTNGGILRQPTLRAGRPEAESGATRVISERTSDTMRRLMRLVVTDGSGKGAEVAGYFVGGKTGTAQKQIEGGRGYAEGRRIAAFVGAFPMNAPRYAIYVMVDEPKPNAQSHGYATAGWVAAPAAGAVIRRVAPILGMVPETERAAQIQASIAIPMQPARPAGAARNPPRAAGVAPGRAGGEAPGRAGGEAPGSGTTPTSRAVAPSPPAGAAPPTGVLPPPPTIRRTDVAPPPSLLRLAGAAPDATAALPREAALAPR